MKRNLRNMSRAKRGFTMMEVIFSMTIFLMMILVFASVFPFAIQASRFANNYSQASMIAQHKIDQLRQQGYSGITTTNLTNVAIVDSGTCSTSGTATSCKFTNVDNVADNGTNVGYFPAGSTATLTWAKDSGAGNDTATGQPNVLDVHVQVAWSGGGMTSGEYTLAAKIVQMTHT